MKTKAKNIKVVIVILTTLLLFVNEKIYADTNINEFIGKSIRIKSDLGERYLTVRGGRSERKTALGISYDAGGFAQIFTLENAGDGYFYIKSETGGYVHVWRANPNPKAIVCIWEKVNQDNLKWTIEKSQNGGVYIRSKLGNYLDVQWGKSDIGTPVWMWSFNGTAAQKWHLELFKESNMTSFSPKKNGFRFTNSFKNGVFRNGPNVFEFGGLCGGMVYSALDYFYSSNTDIPKTDAVPVKNSPLENYIYDRQQSSFFPNVDKWLELTFNPFGTRDRQFYFWGLEGRLATLKNRIDKNQPVPLGLYTTGNGFSGHHQVLAIGYDLGGYRFLKEKDNKRGLVKIFIYDPNYPKEIMILKPDLHSTWSYHHSKEENGTYTETYEKKRWRTYFIDDKYQKKTPINFNN